MNLLADVGKCFDHIMSFRDGLIGRKSLEFVKDCRSDTDEGFLRPGEKPVDRAAVDQSWEFSAPDPQRISNGAHRQDDV